MAFYHKLGKIPHKRHTQFRKSDGSLYKEEVMGLRGFSGIQSILYHEWPPTSVKNSSVVSEEEIAMSPSHALSHRHLKTIGFSSKGDSIASREWLLVNNDIKIGLGTPTENSMNYFYRNGACDEMIFVHEGHGMFLSQFGNMSFRQGDYIVIPVGTTYQLELQSKCRFLWVESTGALEFPKRYRNEYGQLLEHSPFCERDIRVPEELTPKNQKGEFEVRVRMQNVLNSFMLGHHPFDVVGWDGYLYPFIFNIEDFEPITGRIHMPPPIHQTFAAPGFVVCSFVPRLFDYHPEAIPVPYNHSNVNSDEVLYYVEGDFMSRKGIDRGSFTHHPAGIPHGPHPGTTEKSLGQKETKELAVMIDTHAPLRLTKKALELSDPDYIKSWYHYD